MLNQEDEYIVEVCNGDKHYFKNGKLHCESGPAVVHEGFINPIADNLYTPVDVKKGKGKYETYFIYRNGLLDRPTEHKVFEYSYYLEGVGYEEIDFNVIILRKELEEDLNSNQKVNKKVKL